MARKPTFSPDQDMDNVTPQDLQDAQTRTKERRAYNEASGNLPKTEDEARAKIQKQILSGSKNTYGGENTNAMGDTYKKGGMTAFARADGCATKGKTKGRFV
jgi:hypothetical protein